MKSSQAINALLLSILLLCSSITLAGTTQYDFGINHNIQYSGYVGYRHLFSENTISETYDGTGHPELGANIIYNNDNFQIFNQFRYGDNIDTILVYNFMQYTFNLADETNLTIKGGKLRHDYGLYNISRINPRTRQGVIMPQSIYWDAFDEFMTSGTGVGFTLQYKDLELSYTIDDPTIPNSEKTARVFTNGAMNTISGYFGSHQIATLAYSSSQLPLLIKTSWMRMELGKDTKPILREIRPQLANKNAYAETITLGMEYKWDRLILAGETMWFRVSDQSWTDVDNLNKGYSLTATYQLTEQLDVRLNYNEYNADGSKTLHSTTPWMDYYRDLNLGLNYHKKNWMIQVEGHHINGSRALDLNDVTSDADAYKDWWMVGMNVVYSF